VVRRRHHRLARAAGEVNQSDEPGTLWLVVR
jgi:hypothetical protein